MEASPKLTTPAYIILWIVRTVEEATPYEMKQYAANSVDHFWSVRHAQFYSEPDRLVDQGYLTVRREQGGRRRKHYRLTDAGADVLAAWQRSPSRGRVGLRDEAMLKLFVGTDPAGLAEEQIPIVEQHLRELEDALATVGEFMTPAQRLGVTMGIEVEKTIIAHWQKIAALD